VVPEGTPGAIWIRGTVLDGEGRPVPDSLIETWQADDAGRFRDADDPGAVDAGFRGFGRSGAEPDGEWSILTVKPGPTTGPGGVRQAPHVDVVVFARGLLKGAVTRIYFEDEPEANAADPVLASVDPTRRATLLARPTEDGYRFDVRLQGNGETVFFHLA
jgi:protocatechuate 3,4-dioxygenase alpha subunit